MIPAESNLSIIQKLCADKSYRSGCTFDPTVYNWPGYWKLHSEVLLKAFERWFQGMPVFAQQRIHLWDRRLFQAISSSVTHTLCDGYYCITSMTYSSHHKPIPVMAPAVLGTGTGVPGYTCYRPNGVRLRGLVKSRTYVVCCGVVCLSAGITRLDVTCISGHYAYNRMHADTE